MAQSLFCAIVLVAQILQSSGQSQSRSVKISDGSEVCQHFGARCPLTTPCCNTGWCSNDVRFCGDGCEVGGSYVDACLAPDSCFPMDANFEKGRVVEKPAYLYDPTRHFWVSDYGHERAIITPQNTLKIFLTPPPQSGMQGGGTMVHWTRSIHFGHISVTARATPIPGVVNSITIKSAKPSDEIDFEFVGFEPRSVQTNYFWNDIEDWTNMRRLEVQGSRKIQDWHVYEIIWTPEYITWIVDSIQTRTLLRNQTFDSSTGAFKFPSKPARLSLSIWDGGNGPKGTSEWAGGKTDFSSNILSEFVMEIARVKVDCWNGEGMEIDATPMKFRKNTTWKTIDGSTRVVPRLGMPNYASGKKSGKSKSSTLIFLTAVAILYATLL